MRWIYIKGEAIPLEDYTPAPRVHILGDYEPYQSMKTGEMIQGRSQHREHIKRHDLVELGTEKVKPPKPIETAPGLKETIARIVYEKVTYK